MSAQSVTGRGQGMSHGKFKRDNNAGCGNCGGKKCTTPEPTPKVKRGCYVRATSGNITKVNVGANPSNLKVC